MTTSMQTPVQHLATATQMREMDRLTIEEVGIPGLQLMEYAGRGAASAVLNDPRLKGPIAVLCGAGNNGGDGYVVARLLAQAGYMVDVFLASHRGNIKGDAATNLECLSEADLVPIPIHDDIGPFRDRAPQYQTIIDALLGTGLKSEPRSPHKELIQLVNELDGVFVVAMDLPSGLSADSGQTLGVAMRCDRTFTFGMNKVGLVMQPGADYTGQVDVIPIGIPQEISDRFDYRHHVLSEELARSGITRRLATAHKGHFGHVLVLAGSEGKHGAAMLASLAALRVGAGLVTLASDADSCRLATAAFPELMTTVLSEDESVAGEQLTELLDAKTAVLAGPGWGVTERNRSLLHHLERLDRSLPLILDADALTLLSRQQDLFSPNERRPYSLVLTPHPGEAARLLGTSSAKIQAERLHSAATISERYGATTVLKGAGTLVNSTNGHRFICPFGNPGMATAGMGDVLSGALAGLSAQGMAPLQAVLSGVSLHALAGDLASSRLGQRGLLATDVIRQLPAVLRAWEQGRNLNDADYLP